jgi:hypothetical protein
LDGFEDLNMNLRNLVELNKMAETKKVRVFWSYEGNDIYRRE